MHMTTELSLFEGWPPYDPPKHLKRLRSDDPVSLIPLPDGTLVWFITRYEHVRQVLADDRFSRAALVKSQASTTGSGTPKMTLPDLDPPEHTRLRSMLARAFNTRSVQRLRPRLQEIIDELLDTMIEKGPPCDLVANFSEPLSFQAVCELVGVPRDCRDQVWAHAIPRRNLDVTALLGNSAEEAKERMAESIRILLAEKRRRGLGSDLLSTLINQHDRRGAIDADDLVGLGITVLIVGHLTTTDQIANSVLSLLRYPRQWQSLRNSPDMVPRAVEELMRHSAATAYGMLRMATEDIIVGGKTIRAGETVMVAICAANRDEAMFSCSDQLDLERTHPKHLSFGYGTHFCLGAHLAREELNLSLRSLLSRFPNLYMALPEDQLCWFMTPVTRGVQKLLVSW
jgi:cytochrome P450